MDKRKGQVAVEFLMYAGLFMIIAIGAYVLTSFTERGEVSLRESQLINAFGYKFANSPTIAYAGGEGFTYDISFANILDGRPYNATYICRTTAGEYRCSVQIGWKGTYQDFVYPYTIAPANYVVKSGSGACLSTPSSSSGITAIYFDPEKSDGHLLFNNTGVQPGESYPTIELYCEVP